MSQALDHCWPSLGITRASKLALWSSLSSWKLHGLGLCKREELWAWETNVGLQAFLCGSWLSPKVLPHLHKPHSSLVQFHHFPECPWRVITPLSCLDGGFRGEREGSTTFFCPVLCLSTLPLVMTVTDYMPSLVQSPHLQLSCSPNVLSMIQKFYHFSLSVCASVEHGHVQSSQSSFLLLAVA